MDLNASPLPEEDVSAYSEIVDKGPAGQKRRVTEAETMYQERGGAHQRSKRKHLDEEPVHMIQPSSHGQGFQTRDEGSYDRNSLPPGWLDCPAYGDEIGFIVPSKVPLGESFNDKITTGKRYSPQQAINQQRRLGRELGLVIDLTNTNRYYSETDWTKEGIRYVKIRCAGRDSVPDKESIDKFLYEVNRFGSQQSLRNEHVLVHCTHGHNRTGYMIAHFLIQSESVSVTEAIDRFAKARPPGIYKQDYIDGLYNFYRERKPEFLVCPQTPEWKRSPDREDGGAVSLDDHVTRIMEMTNDDILGDPVPPNQLEPMRQFVCQALKLRAGGKQYFPGSHPVSLSSHRKCEGEENLWWQSNAITESKNLPLLSQRYYYATWKADGTRYMMLITWDGCYLIDRNFIFRRIHLRFPCRNVNEGTAGNTHHYTLLDGEMIIDTDPSTQKQERRYLIYDMMAINQMSLVERPFSERWMLLENEVIKPRNYERDLLFKSRTPYYRYDLELFRVRRKDFFFLSTVTKLLKEFIPRLSHASDGLIFQGWDDPYVPRTHEGLLKWKFPEMNSVDFLFEVGSNGRPLLFLHERGRRKLMEGERVIFKDESVDMLSLSGKIIECSFDSEGKVWIFMRTRPDKSTPNEYNTYKKVMRSIYDNITEEVILEQMDQITGLPLYVDRIRNDCRAFQKNTRRK